VEQSESDALPAQWLNADLPSALAKLERAMILHAPTACRGNRAEAARRLNINRQLLYSKLERYGLTDKIASEMKTSGVKNHDS
jgi:two-component system NtrC family response regulator